MIAEQVVSMLSPKARDWLLRMQTNEWSRLINDEDFYSPEALELVGHGFITIENSATTLDCSPPSAAMPC